MFLRTSFSKLHWLGNMDRVRSAILRYGSWVRAAIYALLTTLMLLSLALYEDWSRPLNVSNVLYEEISCSQPQPSDPRCDLVHNRGASAGGPFLEVLLALAVTVLLLTVAWRVTSAMRFRVLLLFPFAVVTVIYVLLVPRFYGVTIVQSTFSSVAISDDDVSSNPSEPRFFLMNKTAEAFLLWDADKQEVVWLPVAQAPLARVGRRHSLGAVIERQAHAEGLSREKAQ
jgi:hypothetical protein